MKLHLNAVCLLLLLIIIPHGLYAQTVRDDSSTSTQHPQRSNIPVVLPLDYVNKHIYATLIDKELGKLFFVIDTGSTRTIIDGKIAKKGIIHTSFWKTTVSFNGYGNKQSTEKYRTVSLSLQSGQIPIFSGNAIVLDLDTLSAQFGIHLDGILGWDFFQQWCSTLDYAEKHLILKEQSQCLPPSGRHATLEGKWLSDGLLLPSILTFPNGHSAKADLLFDTGNDATLFLNTQFRSAAGLSKNGSGASGAGGWGINGSYAGDIVPISSIDFEAGKLHIDGKHTTTVLIGRNGSFTQSKKLFFWTHDAKINRDGTIGNGILEHLTWTFDPAAKCIYAAPAAVNEK